MKKYITILIILVFAFSTTMQSQINAYAQVTSIDANNTNLTISNVNETYGSFVEGEKVIVYHTQGSVVTDFSNTASFGEINTIGNTGLVEVATISTITYVGLIPTEISLTGGLNKTIELSENSNIQVISYPEYNNYSSTNDLTALPWDGNIGGIIAIKVNGTFTLSHNISADGAGFSGGNVSNNDGSACEYNTFTTSLSIFGEKGEGVYRVSDNAYKYSKGAISNGGGGGNMHNAGGAGGSNFSVGGNGGEGWNCSSGSGGIGGYSLSNYVINDPLVMFFGGGGGGAQINNSAGSNGSNGGGIIFIDADTVFVNTSVKISTNGSDAANTISNDGAGGGGAGGSIFIKAKKIDVDLAGGGNITLESNGGNGGSVNHNASHGGGGGGGSGLIKGMGFDPSNTPGITTATSSGLGGADDISSSPRETAETGVDANGNVAYGNSGFILPVELIEQKVICTSTGAEITWATTTEINNDYFEIEKSEDMHEWKFVAEIAGALNSNTEQEYEFEDTDIGKNVTYYRIRQTDVDGTFEYFDILSILCQLENNKLEIIGVNSGYSNINVYIKTAGYEPISAYIHDTSGKLLSEQIVNAPIEGANLINFNDVKTSDGIYIVTIIQSGQKDSKKVYVGNN